MTSSKFALGSLLVVSAALILAACGGGTNDGSEQSAATADLSADRAVLATLGIESALDEEITNYTAVDAALDLFTGTAQNAAGGFGPTSNPDWEAL